MNATAENIPTAPAGPTDVSPALPVPHRRPYAQWIALSAVVLAFVAFDRLGRAIDVPAYDGLGGTLLAQPGARAVMAMLLAAVVMPAVTFLAAVAAGAGWRTAGPLAACAGLTAWSFRAGPIRYDLITADLANPSKAVFVRLALETLLLGLLAGVCWVVVFGAVDRRDSRSTDRLFALPDSGTLTAVLTQVLLMGVAVMQLVPSADKKQAIFGVLASAFIATGISHHYNRDEAAVRWYWIGPMVVGLIGYLAVGFSAAAQEAVETGRLTGTFAALARPLPLDYIGAGGVGVVLGYWIAAEHHAESLASAKTE
jgi:hypothetical protein